MMDAIFIFYSYCVIRNKLIYIINYFKSTFVFFFLGNSFDRPKKFKRGVLFTSEEEKNKYIQESKEWAKRLSEKFDLPNGKTSC
jgi:hypothetical protein